MNITSESPLRSITMNKFGDGVLSAAFVILFTILVCMLASMFQAESTCRHALDRSHTATDTASLYRLNVCNDLRSK